MARGIYVVLLYALCLFQSSRGYPTSTEPPNFCMNKDGHHYGIGESYRPNPCTFCLCEASGEQCAMIGCMAPRCPYPISNPNQCCSTCPNGPACRGLNGEEVPEGHTVTYSGGMQCTCSFPIGGMSGSYNGFGGDGLSCSLPAPGAAP